MTYSCENKKYWVPYLTFDSYIWKKKLHFSTKMLTIFSHNFHFFFYKKAIKLILLKMIIPKSCFLILFSFSQSLFFFFIENENDIKKINKQTQTSFSLKVWTKTRKENLPPNHIFWIPNSITVCNLLLFSIFQMWRLSFYVLKCVH